MKLDSLRKSAKVLFIAGCILISLTAIAVVETAIYEWIVPPTDMHLPGLLAAAMMVVVAPTGALLVVFGGLMWVIVYLAIQRNARKHIS